MGVEEAVNSLQASRVRMQRGIQESKIQPGPPGMIRQPLAELPTGYHHAAPAQLLKLPGHHIVCQGASAGEESDIPGSGKFTQVLTDFRDHGQHFRCAVGACGLFKSGPHPRGHRHGTWQQIDGFSFSRIRQDGHRHFQVVQTHPHGLIPCPFPARSEDRRQ